MAQKLTPAVVQSVHRLAADKLSGRAIAGRLGISEASVRRALAQDPAPVRRLPPPARKPTLLSHPINPPAPCPESAPSWCRRLYTALAARGLTSELDALIVAADLDVPRCHLTLNVFDVDVLLQRIAALPERVDLGACIARLQDAFTWDDKLREWCREVAQDAGL